MKQILSASIIIALLGASCASAATYYYTNGSGDQLWSTEANWNLNIVPTAGDTAYLSLSAPMTISTGVNAVANRLYVGVGAANAGTGSLTIDGGSLAVVTDTYIANTAATNTVPGASTLSLINGSSFSCPILSLGRGQTGAASNVNYEGWFIVDKTSSASVATTLEVGRRYGTGHLILEGDETQGAIVEVGRMTFGTETGTGYITIGTHARLTIGTYSTLGYGTVAVNGGMLQFASTGTGNTTLSTTSITAQNGTVSVGSVFQTTNSALSFANSTLTVSGASSLTASTLSLSGSNAAFSDVLATSSTVSLVSSTFSGTTLTVSTGSIFTASGSLVSLLGDLRLASDTVIFNVSNSSMLVGGTFSGLGTISIADSTLSAAAWRADSSGARSVISGTTITIGSATPLATNLAVTNGHTTLSGSTLSIGANGQASTGRLSLSGSVVNLSEGGRLVVGTTLSVLGSTVSVDASTVTAGNITVYITVGADSVLSLNNGSSLFTNITTTSGTTSIVGTFNVSGNSTFSNQGSIEMSASGALNATGSHVSVGTSVSQSGASVLNLTNSTLVIGGQLLQQYTGGNSWTGSTVSAAAWGARFSDAKTTLSNTIMTLSAATAQPVTAYADSTAFAYLTNGSQLHIGANGNLYIGRLSVLDNSTLSMTDGSASLTATLTVSGAGALASVSGGLVNMNSDSRTTMIQVGEGGTLAVSGTGVITGVAVANINANGTFSGTMYVGTLPGLPWTSSYVSTQTLSAQSGAKFLGIIGVTADGNMVLNLSGTASSLAAVTAQSMTFTDTSVLTVNFDDLALSGDAELTLLLSDTLSGLNLANIVTQNLDASYQVEYSQELVGAQQALIATLTAIPEPAAAAVLMGLLGLAAVARRRR